MQESKSTLESTQIWLQNYTPEKKKKNEGVARKGKWVVRRLENRIVFYDGGGGGGGLRMAVVATGLGLQKLREVNFFFCYLAYVCVRYSLISL